MVLIEHDVIAKLVREQPLVVIAMKKIRRDLWIALAIGQIDAQLPGMVAPRIRIGLLGELIHFHGRITL